MPISDLLRLRRVEQVLLRPAVLVVRAVSVTTYALKFAGPAAVIGSSVSDAGRAALQHLRGVSLEVAYGSSALGLSGGGRGDETASASEEDSFRSLRVNSAIAVFNPPLSPPEM